MFKKLFYVCLLFVCSIFLINAKPKNRNITLGASSAQYDDTNQGEQSFVVLDTAIPDPNAPPNTYPPRFLVVGRADPKQQESGVVTLPGFKTIDLIPLSDNTPDSSSAVWNGTKPVSISATLGHHIWGWTVDEINSVVYTLESSSRTDASADVHAYVVQSGKFVEVNQTGGYIPGYFKHFDSNTIGDAWARKAGNSPQQYPMVGMAFLKGHLLYVDGGKISSAEKGITSSIIPSGYNAWPLTQWIKNLSRVATPNSGDVLIGAGPMGNIVVIDFDSTNNTFKELYSGQLSALNLQYPCNFKMTPVKVNPQDPNSKTVYSLTFVAETPQNPMRTTFYTPIIIDSNNQINWSATFNAVDHQNFFPFDQQPGNTHAIQAIIPVDTNPGYDTDQLGSQYLATLYYYQYKYTNLKFGQSHISANFFVKKDIDNTDVFEVQKKRTMSDNIIGVVFGTPPLYAANKRISTNSVDIEWGSEKDTSSSSGFSVDTSLTVGFSLKAVSPFGAVKTETSFGIFADYKKNLTRGSTVKIGKSTTYTQSSDDTGHWANNKGWLLVSRGYATYNAYRLEANTTNFDKTIVDNNGTPVIVISLVPSETSPLRTEWITFRLTDGAIAGSTQDTGPDSTPDTINDWGGYSDGLKAPGSSGIFQDQYSMLYWVKDSERDINAEKNNAVSVFSSDQIQVALANSKGKVIYINDLYNSTDTSGQVGGSFEQKVSGSTNAYGVTIGGSFDFKISAAYEYATTSMTKNTQAWSAESDTESSGGNSQEIPTMRVTMQLLKPTSDTKKKPFWIPQWAWDKGNRPWLITWTADTQGPLSLPKAKIKTKKTPSSTPAKL